MVFVRLFLTETDPASRYVISLPHPFFRSDRAIIASSCGRRVRPKVHGKGTGFYAAEQSTPLTPRRESDVQPPRRAVFCGVPRLR